MMTSAFRVCGTLMGLLALVSCGSDQKTGTLNLAAQYSEPTSLKAQAITPAPFTFKMCIKSVKLENESNESTASDNEESEERDEIAFSVGEVDLTNMATQSISFGALSGAPVDFKIKQLKVRLKKFGTCAHSIEYGSKNSDATIVFRWKFNPAIEITNDDTLDLFLSDIVTAIQNADQNNPGSFRAALQQVQAKARRRR